MPETVDKPDNSDVAQPQKISLKGFGAGIDLENVSLNTFFTLIGFLLIVLVSWTVWEHRDDTKAHGRELIVTIKEIAQEQRTMTQAMREANCLSTLSQDERKRDSEICKRATR